MYFWDGFYLILFYTTEYLLPTGKSKNAGTSGVRWSTPTSLPRLPSSATWLGETGRNQTRRKRRSQATPSFDSWIPPRHPSAFQAEAQEEKCGFNKNPLFWKHFCMMPKIQLDKKNKKQIRLHSWHDSVLKQSIYTPEIEDRYQTWPYFKGVHLFQGPSFWLIIHGLSKRLLEPWQVRAEKSWPFIWLSTPHPCKKKWCEKTSFLDTFLFQFIQTF